MLPLLCPRLAVAVGSPSDEVLKVARSLCPPVAVALAFGHGGEKELTALKALSWQRVDGVDICTPEVNFPKPPSTTSSAPDSSLMVSELDQLEPGRAYDAVFAMTVLCSDPTNPYAAPISFELFERVSEALCERVKLGGVLVLTNAQYDFRDTRASDKFSGVRFPVGVKKPRSVVTKLSPSAEPMPEGISQGVPVIFRREET